MQVVASFLLLIELPDFPECYNSPLQEREINVRRFKAFLNERCTTKDIITQTDAVKSYIEQINFIQQGYNLWQQTNLPPLMRNYRLYYILRLQGSRQTLT